MQGTVSKRYATQLTQDMPQHTAETLAHFWQRNDRLPPGVQPVGASS